MPSANHVGARLNPTLISLSAGFQGNPRLAQTIAACVRGRESCHVNR